MRCAIVVYSWSNLLLAFLAFLAFYLPKLFHETTGITQIGCVSENTVAVGGFQETRGDPLTALTPYESFVELFDF